MNLDDPVDAAALFMFVETKKYIDAIEAGDPEPDPTHMVKATEDYAAAVEASLVDEEPLSPEVLQRLRQRVEETRRAVE